MVELFVGIGSDLGVEVAVGVGMEQYSRRARGTPLPAVDWLSEGWKAARMRTVGTRWRARLFGMSAAVDNTEPKNGRYPLAVTSCVGTRMERTE